MKKREERTWGAMTCIIIAVGLALASCSKDRLRGDIQSVGPVAGASAEKHAAGGNELTETDALWLSRKGIAALAGAFRALGLDAKEEGATVSVAGKRISIDARIDQRLEKQGRHILAADFDISIGGTRVSALMAGAIGVGDTPEHARNTAVAEWAAQYGAPIGFAMATRFGASGPPPRTNSLAAFYAKVEVAGQTLFHGPPGLRGEVKEPGAVSSDEFLRRIAIPVVANFRRAPRFNGYRTATIQLVVTGTAVTDGECRVDGVVSPELLDALSRLSWPAGSPSYMFKLFFVSPDAGT